MRKTGFWVVAFMMIVLSQAFAERYPAKPEWTDYDVFFMYMGEMYDVDELMNPYNGSTSRTEQGYFVEKGTTGASNCTFYLTDRITFRSFLAMDFNEGDEEISSPVIAFLKNIAWTVDKLKNAATLYEQFGPYGWFYIPLTGNDSGQAKSNMPQGILGRVVFKEKRIEWAGLDRFQSRKQDDRPFLITKLDVSAIAILFTREMDDSVELVKQRANRVVIYDYDLNKFYEVPIREKSNAGDVEETEYKMLSVEFTKK